MSPNVGNFVHDLVEMAKAMEELPQVRDELASKAHELDGALHRIQEREEAIARYKAEIDQLHAKVRSTEAERDDAELRFLDGEDRTRSALDFIKGTFGSAGSLIQALEPPAKVEPVSEAIPMPPAEPEVIHQPTMPPEPQGGWGQSEHPLPHLDAQSTGLTPNSSETQPMVPSTSPAPTADHANSSEVPKSDANPLATTGENTDGATTAEPLSVDNVSYANEPEVGSDWSAWNHWCSLMTQRFGNVWPDRSKVGTPI